MRRGLGLLVWGAVTILLMAFRTPAPPALPAPPFIIRAFDPQHDANAQCLTCLASGLQDLNHPGEYRWAVSTSVGQPASFPISWCAVDRQTLAENLSQMQFRLLIDGYSVDLTNSALVTTAQTETPDAGLGKPGVCQTYSVLVDGWLPGPHSLIWVQHIDMSLSDGWGTYEPGDYRMEWLVDVR